MFPVFQTFATPHGVPITLESLPFSPTGSNVVWHTTPYLASSARAFPIVRQRISAPTPDCLRHDAPLWHSRLLRNAHKLSYYSPALIRSGVTTVGQLIEYDTHFDLIGPSWTASSVQQQGTAHSGAQCPTTFAVESVDFIKNGGGSFCCTSK